MIKNVLGSYERMGVIREIPSTKFSTKHNFVIEILTQLLLNI